jgi:hypothetical protein
LHIRFLNPNVWCRPAMFGVKESVAVIMV